MGTWKTDIEQIRSDSLATLRGGLRTLNDAFGSTSFINRDIQEAKSFFTNGTSVVGINVAYINRMKNEIRAYVARIDKQLEGLKNCNPTVAFKGDAVVPALQEYIEAVKTACGAITSNLLAFCDQLTAVEKAYYNKDTSTSSAIKRDAKSTRTAFTEYKEGSEDSAK